MMRSKFIFSDPIIIIHIEIRQVIVINRQLVGERKEGESGGEQRRGLIFKTQVLSDVA